MSTSPSSKPSPAVYRRRRLVALVGVVVVIALIWWLVSALFGGGGNPAATTSPTSTEVDTAEAAPAETTDPEPTPTETPMSTPEPEPTPTVCTEAEVAVTAVVDSESYDADQLPQFSVTLENTSDTSCIIDVGTASQVYTVMSGSDTIWVSTHCQENSDSQVVELVAGKEVSAPAIEWSRERSNTDTCDDENRPDAVTGGAYYNLTVKIGGITSDPVYFALY
ncbi:hypothetical protein [Gulosibacter chungangensis]|uniref:DUF4232 domain-containing protein n=1 Tax=Gulosibacter chungangensis TaxID=979746 RepID=A0A7J5B7K8_9MICO|nr:hypothetical protein [Gulosibacter chungangensis]KAB1640806.1 hypothetical protein F8O05_13975 [Gulosibacter chungangensis]